MSVQERLLSGVQVDSDGCWLWMRAKLPKGYGRMWANGSLGYTHRISYELFVGQVPEGFQVDHLCRKPSCCNPAHLEAVTPRENTLRGTRGHLPKSCKRGHEWSPENTIHRADGRRRCRRCAQLTARANRRGMGVDALLAA